jgi:hypothetical protein
MALTRVTGGFGMSSSQSSSPAAQRYMHWQAKNSLRRQYGDVASSLGLSQDQADKLIDLLADQHGQAWVNGPQSVDNRQLSLQTLKDAKVRTDAAIASLLGEQGAAQWQEYQKTLPEHVQANMFAEQMQNMGAPITDDQRAQLYNIFLEEKPQSTPPPMTSMADAAAREELFKQSMKAQDDRERSILERAKSVLTSEQFERYRDYQAFQAEMRQNFRPAMMASPTAGGNVVTFSADSATASGTFTSSAK